MKLHTVKVPHRKNTKSFRAVAMPTPALVTLPTVMHIGAPAKPIVKPGDSVALGQPVAEPGGVISSFVHAPVSGTVKSVSRIRLANGALTDAITIASDGENRYYTGLVPPEVTDFQSFTDAVRASGVVGLGGAGFPTMIKLSPKNLAALDTVIVNGAECEPYITSDTRTMLDRTNDIADGVSLLRRFLGAKRVIIAVEDNKPECIQKLKTYFPDEKTEIAVLPSRYPQGSEKVLIYNILGRTVAEGKLPIDVGVIVLNCTTLAVVANYIKTGMPLIQKCVTVDGDAVMHPMNVLVPIGTPVADVFAFTGGFKQPPAKILYGGPMMGITMPDTSAPVLKNTNALIALSERSAKLTEPSACIRCGRCVSHCPMNLMPPMIAAAYKKRDGDALCELKVNLCMECGCCAYVCPAHRPIVQTNKLAKRLAADAAKSAKGAGKK